MKKKLVRHYSWNTESSFKGKLPKTWRWETSECDCCGSTRRYKTYLSWRLIFKGAKSRNYDKFLGSSVKEYAKMMAKHYEAQRPIMDMFKEK